MANITINTKKNVIEMSKGFAKRASKFGTDEYKMLQEARRDYPDYCVVTAQASKKAKNDSFKGLTYKYMEKYIDKHDDENQTIMKEYEILRGLSDEAEELMAEPLSYGEMKEWFLKTFPEIKAFNEKRAAILAA